MKDLKEVSLFVVLMISSSSIWLSEANVAINQTDMTSMTNLTNNNMTTATNLFDDENNMTNFFNDDENNPRSFHFDRSPSRNRAAFIVFALFSCALVAFSALCYGYCILQTIRSWCCLPKEFDLDEQQRRVVLENIFSATSKTVTENTFPKKKKSKPHDGNSVAKPEKKQQEGEDHPANVEIPQGSTPREANEKLEDIPLDLETGHLTSPADKQEEQEARDNIDSLDQSPNQDDKLDTGSANNNKDAAAFVLSSLKPSPPSPVAAKYSPACISTSPQIGTFARIRRSLSWGQKAIEKESDEEVYDEEKGKDGKTPASAKSLGDDDDDDDTDENVCAICISGYKPGDVVVSSKYCKHVFHKECILEWLGKHDMCPCCRVDMVTDTDMNKAAMKVVGQTKIMKLVQSLGLVPHSSFPSDQRGAPPTTRTSDDSNNTQT